MFKLSIYDISSSRGSILYTHGQFRRFLGAFEFATLKDLIEAYESLTTATNRPFLLEAEISETVTEVHTKMVAKSLADLRKMPT